MDHSNRCCSTNNLTFEKRDSPIRLVDASIRKGNNAIRVRLHRVSQLGKVTNCVLII